MAKSIHFDGSEVAFSGDENQTLLDSAEQNGYSIPYSCRKGVCSTCLGELVTGVIQDRANRIEGPCRDVYFCQAKPLTDVTIKPAHWSEYDPTSRKTLDAKIKKVNWLTSDVAEVVLRFPIGVRAIFRAGQYLNVHFEGVSRSYSMANPPHKNTEAVLHVKKYASGLFSDAFLSNAAPNQLVEVELPYGDVDIDLTASDPLLLLATGTGFAPVKSILDSLVHLRAHRPVHLFWGGRHEQDLYMAERMRHFEAQHPWFAFTPVLSRPPAGWTGESGWVQEIASRRYGNLEHCMVYACGNHEMVNAARDLCVASGLDLERFYSDSFVPAV